DGLIMRRWDMTNPLFPTAKPAFPLSNPGDANPAALPGEAPHLDTFFPTDLNSEVHNMYGYVVESSSGCIWRFDLVTGFNRGYFFDPRLFGKCPRFIVNGKMFFSQDGDMQASRPVSNATNVNDVLVLDLNIFNPNGFSIIAGVGLSLDKVLA